MKVFNWFMSFQAAFWQLFWCRMKFKLSMQALIHFQFFCASEHREINAFVKGHAALPTLTKLMILWHDSKHKGSI